MHRPIIRHLAVAAIFFAVGAALTWPTLGAFGDGTWGKTWDMLGNLWFFDQARYMAVTGDWSAVTDRVFFPFGYDLRADLAHFLLPALSVPIQLLFTVQPVEIYSVLLLLSLAFSGYAAYLLARRFTDSPTAAAAAGLLWLANPIAVRELAAGSLEVACTGFFVLAFWALLRLADRPTWPRAAALAALWFVTGLTNWVMAGMLGVVVLAASPFLLRGHDRQTRRRLGMMIGGALVCTAVAALPLVGPLLGGERLAIDENDTALARLTPDVALARQSIEPQGDDLTGLIFDSFDPGDFLVAQDGAVPAAPLVWWALGALALAGLLDRRRRTGWLLALAAGFVVLACGPYLRWFNHAHFGQAQTPLPLPGFLAYKLLPGFTLFYRPYRFLLVAALLLVGPTAVGATALLGAMRRWWRGALVVLGAGAVALAAYQGDGGAFVEVFVPEEYESVVATLPAGALLEVPFFPLPVSRINAQAMLAQTHHLKPIFNATLLRAPAWRKLAQFADANSVIGTLLDLQLKRDGPVRVQRADAAALAEMGFGHVLVHTAFASGQPDIERYQRMPHELFLLMDRLFGPARELPFARVYATANAPADGETGVPPEAVTRVRFERLYYRPQINLEPVGHVSLELGADGRSERLAVAVPPAADGATQLCFWVRRKEVLGVPGELSLALGGDEGEFAATAPLEPGPQWRRLCRPREAGAAPRPSSLTWLQLRSDRPESYVVDLDDVAFVDPSR